MTATAKRLHERIMDALIITIDGPAGSGKSTAARNLAKALGIAFLDTGATYRAAALKVIRAGVSLDDSGAIAQAVRDADIRLESDPAGVTVHLDGQDVTGDIRLAIASETASRIAGIPAVRQVLVELQRKIARQLGSFVSEGRDQGSVVFPDARVKFYVIASPQVRAQRRLEEMVGRGEQASLDEILQSILQRDTRDSTRASSPLIKPADAIEVDTSGRTAQDVMAELLCHVEARCK